MCQRKLLLSLVTASLLLGSASAFAADPSAEPIFGSQLMTEQERTEHRSLMRTARTEEERAAIRARHHEQMLQRAKERGVTLPAEPPAQRPYAGPRSGMGPGGQGMGPGGGRP